jgi:hypothetical protein
LCGNLIPHADIAELDDALMRIKQSDSTTLVVQPGPFTYGQRGRIIASAMKNGLGTIFAFPVAAREGSLAVELQLVEVRAADELDRAFSTVARERADALLVLASAMLFNERKQIVDLATKHRLPSMSNAREFAELGALWSEPH